jgi:hypothetical protein
MLGSPTCTQEEQVKGIFSQAPETLDILAQVLNLCTKVISDVQSQLSPGCNHVSFLSRTTPQNRSWEFPHALQRCSPEDMVLMYTLSSLSSYLPHFY